MARKTKKHPEAKIWVMIPEDVVTHLATPENLLGRDDEDDLELGVRIDMAVQEIAQALVESGRPLKHLHLLRESVEC